MRATRPPDAMLLDQMLAGGPSVLPAREVFVALRTPKGAFESLSQLLARAIEAERGKRSNRKAA